MSNVVNYAGVKFWQRLGLKRIILSRELSLKEVAEIREECPDIELEVFVHGALCIAYSGRCLLSGYISHRDSNQGACTNTCRWKYDTLEARETSTGDIVPINTVNDSPPVSEPKELPLVLLEEETRPGELMPAFEDEHGTYIMNSKDLRSVQHVQTLAAMGIDSLVIKDMAGILTPIAAEHLVSALVREVGVPIQLHSHATSGMATATYVEGVRAGAGAIDCAISVMSGSSSQPPVETMLAIFDETDYHANLDIECLRKINKYFEALPFRDDPAFFII